jgi:copper(I)-binding protein
MNKIRLSQGIAIIIFFIANFAAQATEVGNITVSDAYIRASIPGTIHSSAYLRINNKDEKTVTLVSVSSKISPRIEMHNHVMENGMMHMQKLQKIAIEGNSEVLLQPHGLHLMVFNLAEPLIPDDVIEVTLHFSNNHRVIVSLPVKSLK